MGISTMGKTMVDDYDQITDQNRKKGVEESWCCIRVRNVLTQGRKGVVPQIAGGGQKLSSGQ